MILKIVMWGLFTKHTISVITSSRMTVTMKDNNRKKNYDHEK